MRISLRSEQCEQVAASILGVEFRLVCAVAVPSERRDLKEGLVLGKTRPPL